MKVIVSGGTGFLGREICRALIARGYEVKVLTRNPARVSIGNGVQWHPPEPGPWHDSVAWADVVINLAGESIAGGRWTDERKRSLRTSRVELTRALVAAIPSDGHSRRLVSVSAVGYYGDRGEATLDEAAGPGTGFLADLGREWEAAALEAGDRAAVTIPRLGIVLGPGGGMLQAIRPIFRLGLGGRLGDGRQWMPWVSRNDVVRFVGWILDDPSRTGVYNLTAPDPVRNHEFTKVVGEALHRPTVIPAPAFALKLVLGQMADETLLASQRAVPRRALEEGFRFEDTRLGPLLDRCFD